MKGLSYENSNVSNADPGCTPGFQRPKTGRCPFRDIFFRSGSRLSEEEITKIEEWTQRERQRLKAKQ